MGHLCDADYNVIKNWRWDSNITGNYDEFLTSQGWNDEKFLAKQFQRILPNVLDNIYTPDKFLVNTLRLLPCKSLLTILFFFSSVTRPRKGLRPATKHSQRVFSAITRLPTSEQSRPMPTIRC